MHWEPLMMALLLGVMGIWSGYVGLVGSPSSLAPRSRRTGERGFSLERMIFAISPKAHEAGTRVMLACGGLAALIGAVYCVRLAFTP